LLEKRDFLDPPCVPATLKFGLQPDSNQIVKIPLAKHVA
jgi:hypothetical protein